MPAKRKPPPGTYWRGGTLWGRFQIKGRDIRFSLRTDDAAVAQRLLEAKRKRALAAAHFGQHRPTWQDAVLAWGSHIAASVKPATVKRYAVSLKQVEPYLLDLYLDEIDKPTISTVVRQRRAHGATNATIRRDLVAISSVLGHAEAEDWLKDNPALAQLKRLKERRDPIVLPDPAHIERVIARAPGLMGALIRVAWLTGCRQNELVTLERRQLDLERRQITLERTKSGRARTIEMGGAYDVLRALPVNMATKAVFWHEPGRPYANLASRFSAIVGSAHLSAQREGADFRPFRFHDLRHRFAVDALKAGWSIYDVQQHLGHGSVKTTEVYLAHLTPGEARKAKGRPAQNPALMQRSDAL